MLNRRQWLAGTAAALLPTLPALARAPPTAAQVPGIYRRKLGDIEITAILDGYVPLGAKSFTGGDPGDVPRLVAEAGLTDALPTSVNAFVVNTKDRTYLVDTGGGAWTGLGEAVLRVRPQLARALRRPHPQGEGRRDRAGTDLGRCAGPYAGSQHPAA